MPTFSKTRIAPTPSGFLHMGNVFSFALTKFLAERTGASLLLRIDDMDRDRVEASYLQDVFDTLEFLGISYDEGPKTAVEFEAEYSQRHRLNLYESMLTKLVATGKVYACTCSRRQIEEEFGGHYDGICKHKKIPLDTPGVSWRIDTTGAKALSMRTLDGVIEEIPFPAEMEHFVIRKKDGFPAYQVTSLADDIHNGIDLIVRGEDLFPSTLAQLFLARLLSADAFLNATFHHHQLLTDAKLRKLSKSAGATSVHYWRENGLTPKDLYNQIGEQIGIALNSWRDFSKLLPPQLSKD